MSDKSEEIVAAIPKCTSVVLFYQRCTARTNNWVVSAASLSGMHHNAVDWRVRFLSCVASGPPTLLGEGQTECEKAGTKNYQYLRSTMGGEIYHMKTVSHGYR
jgi:hypothetical protein